MSPDEQRLVVICDDLLRSISAHRKSAGSADAAALIDRVLDIRNRISPPPKILISIPTKPTDQTNAKH